MQYIKHLNGNCLHTVFHVAEKNRYRNCIIQICSISNFHLYVYATYFPSYILKHAYIELHN